MRVELHYKRFAGSDLIDARLVIDDIDKGTLKLDYADLLPLELVLQHGLGPSDSLEIFGDPRVEGNAVAPTVKHRV
jgi:hypothetical protein